jgi:Rha family phage regulatory protein
MLEMDLGVKEYNGVIVVSSRDLARVFGRRHNNVLRDIRELIRKVNKVDPSFARENFISSKFMNRGKYHPEYLLRKNGFIMLTMGFTGEVPVPNKLHGYFYRGCDKNV